MFSSLSESGLFSHIETQESLAFARVFNDAVGFRAIRPDFSVDYSWTVSSFWLLSALLAQLKDEGFKPADPNLFDQYITALSASLASQTSLTSAMSGFVTAKRRESYLAHASCPVGDSVKRELLVASGTESLLFNQPLLEKVVSNIKEDSLISSTASLASLSKAASHGRSGASGSGGSSSPLDFSRPSTSGYGKRSASPRRGDNKRPRRGRGRTPSSTRSKGFRR